MMVGTKRPEAFSSVCVTLWKRRMTATWSTRAASWAWLSCSISDCLCVVDSNFSFFLSGFRKTMSQADRAFSDRDRNSSMLVPWVDLSRSCKEPFKFCGNSAISFCRISLVRSLVSKAVAESTATYSSNSEINSKPNVFNKWRINCCWTSREENCCKALSPFRKLKKYTLNYQNVKKSFAIVKMWDLFDILNKVTDSILQFSVSLASLTRRIR